MTTTLDLHCDVCARVRAFTQPVCVDAHGTDCPEWACTACGAALLIAPVILLRDRSSRVDLRRRTADCPRRASRHSRAA